MREKKRPTAVRLTPEAYRLIGELAAKLGVSRTAVIELAIRRLAEREGIK